MESADLTPAYIQQFLRLSAGISIDIEEAEQLLPLVAASRAALRRLERFDVGNVRPSLTFDPCFPYEGAP